MDNINFMTMSINDFEILDKTFYSLKSNLLDLDLKKQTLILHIDVFPNNNNIEKNKEIASKYFGNVIINIEKECNCSKAFIWCLNNVKTKYFFIIEANKCVKKNFKIQDLINKLKKSQLKMKTPAIHLNPSSKNLILKFGSSHLSLWDNSYMKEILKHLSPNLNYEYQLRELMLLFNYKSITISKERREYLEHIGSKWKEDNKFLLANSSHDYDIHKIIKNENWHKNIYDKFSQKKNKDICQITLDRFKNIYNTNDHDKWLYRWTGIWKYVNLDDEIYFRRHIKGTKLYLSSNIISYHTK